MVLTITVSIISSQPPTTPFVVDLLYCHIFFFFFFFFFFFLFHSLPRICQLLLTYCYSRSRITTHSSIHPFTLSLTHFTLTQSPTLPFLLLQCVPAVAAAAAVADSWKRACPLDDPQVTLLPSYHTLPSRITIFPPVCPPSPPPSHHSSGDTTLLVSLYHLIVTLLPSYRHIIIFLPL